MNNEDIKHLIILLTLIAINTMVLAIMAIIYVFNWSHIIQTIFITFLIGVDIFVLYFLDK